MIWNKLSKAIARESLHDLRMALDHARRVGLSATSSAILHTYADALTRHHQASDLSVDEVLDAIESGAIEQAINMVLEMAITMGGDRNLLLNALTRLSAETTERACASTIATLSGAATMSNGQAEYTNSQNGAAAEPKDMEDNPFMEDIGDLLLVLHSKAADHAKRELNRAWRELDPVGGDSPEHAPFSDEEEHFFIRSQLVNAIEQESLAELRRVLTYGMAFGIDPRSVEIESAYRDALAKHEFAEGFNLMHVREFLENGDWWCALDIIIGAALTRGVDRNTLVKMAGKACPRSEIPPEISPALPDFTTAI
jgi:hypothetical protein